MTPSTFIIEIFILPLKRINKKLQKKQVCLKWLKMILKRMHFKQVIENLIKAGLYINICTSVKWTTPLSDCVLGLSKFERDLVLNLEF